MIKGCVLGAPPGLFGCDSERLMLSKLQDRELRFCDYTFMIYVCWLFCEIASGEIVLDKKETQVTTSVCIPCSNETVLLFVFGFGFFFRKSFTSGILVWEHWSGMQLSQARIIAQCSSLLHFVSKLVNRTGLKKKVKFKRTYSYNPNTGKISTNLMNIQ